MNRPGDWKCRSCHHHNFQRRDSCQRCADPRPGERSSFGFAGPDVRPGDWYCSVGECGAHNFASRSTCFKCAAPKDVVEDIIADHHHQFPRPPPRPAFGYAGASSRSGWKSGDWICTSCNEHNFANRMECYRCTAPKEATTKSPF